MLRSIFSLIQKIIDSDKDYNNKKSSTVIYLASNPDNTLNMDMEINGNPRENLMIIRDRDMQPDPSNSFVVTTDQGDSVTCKHSTSRHIKAKPKAAISNADTLVDEYRTQVETAGDKASFLNDEEEEKEDTEKYAELQGEGGVNVRELLAMLPQKKVAAPEKDKEQIGALLEQIQKMKKGMERLHQIARQFTCSDRFKQDVDFLIKNLSMDKSQSKQKNLTPQSN